MSVERACFETELLNCIYPIIGSLLIVFLLLLYAYKQHCDVGICYKNLKEPIADALNACMQSTIPHHLRAQHNDDWKDHTLKLYANMNMDTAEHRTLTIESENVHVITYHPKKYIKRRKA
uniref:Uncharacterized protein n=1 Tax=Trichuris muris TaxID=70415 RepID=A0A5S6QCT3_TRIMR